MKEALAGFLKFLIEFLKKYPEFGKKAIHLTGESYAGKYLPLFTVDILRHNRKEDSKVKIPITSTMIVDPYAAPIA